MAVSVLEMLQNQQNPKEQDYNDIEVTRSWVEYKDNGNLAFLLFDMKAKDGNGQYVRVHKAIKLNRLIRVPKSAKLLKSFMDMHGDVMTALYQGNVNFLTIIANILTPKPIGLLYLYGVQGVSAESMDDAKHQANVDYAAMTRVFGGTFRTIEMRAPSFEEVEWLRKKMANMKNVQAVRGLPTPRKAAGDYNNSSGSGDMGKSDTQETAEQFIIGMSDYEYVAVLMATPIEEEVLRKWLTVISKDSSKWTSLMQGSKGMNFGISIPMMYMANIGAAQGWSAGSSHGVSANHTDSTGLSQSVGTTHGQSLTMSHGVTDGTSLSHGQSASLGHSASVSHGTTDGSSLTQSHSVSHSHGVSNSQSHSVTDSTGTSQSTSTSHSQGQSWNHGTSSSSSTSSSHSEGTTNTMSHGTSQSHGSSHGTGSNWTSSNGTSASHSSSSSNSQSASQGSSTNLGQSHSTSNSQSKSSANGTTHNNSWNGSVSTGANVSGGIPGIIKAGGSVTVSGGHGVSNGTSHTDSSGTSHGSSDGYSYGQGFSSSNSASSSNSSGNSIGHTHSVGHGGSTTNSTTSSSGVSNSQSVGQSVSNSTSTSTSTGTSSSVGGSESTSTGTSRGTSASHSVGNSTSSGTSESWGTSNGVSRGQTHSTSNSTSQGTSSSQGVSSSQGQTHSTSSSESRGQTVSKSSTTGQSQSHSNGTGNSKSQSQGWNGTMSNGTAGTMGIGPSISFNKTFQWKDIEVENIVQLLEFQRTRLMSSMNGQGAFFVDFFIATDSDEAKQTATASATSAWVNDKALVSPLQVLDLPSHEGKHLLYHMNAFSPCLTKEGIPGQLESYKYSTVLLSDEVVAYTHPPRVSEGGLYAEVEDIPVLSVPSNRQDGEMYLGQVISAERYSPETGYLTPFPFRIRSDELMHAFFAAGSRSGKTVAATRVVAEMANNVRRGPHKKRLRIVAMDPKKDWRILSRFIEPERFRFYSLADPAFLPIKLNLARIPGGVYTERYMNSIVEVFCRSFGLGERGKQILTRAFYEEYTKAGCFAGDGKEFANERSADVTMATIYQNLENKRREMDDPKAKVRYGNDARDAFTRVMDRMESFGRVGAINHTMFCQQGGMSVEELLGKDDVIVLESYGLESTTRAFVFGLVTSAIYQFCVHNGGFVEPDDQYETVLVIEEANEVLMGQDSSAGNQGGGGLQGASEFERILDQAAGNGLFIWAITQKISLMPTSVIANCGLVFAGRQKIPDDINVCIRQIAREERYDDRPLVKFFPRCPTGWFVVQTSRTFDIKDAEPVMVAVERLDVKPPTNKELEQIMAMAEVSRIREPQHA